MEQTFVGERVILAEGEFSIQQNQEIQGEPMPDFQTEEPQKSMDLTDKISK